jgi:hypothetical protein
LTARRQLVAAKCAPTEQGSPATPALSCIGILKLSDFV